MFKKMEAINILKLFTLNETYVIPSYQRAYSWGKKQREQFIQDLREASGKYYLGHFLFENPDNDSRTFLIDGQQRLTTVVIFFSSLRNALSKHAESDVDSKKCDYISDHYLRDRYSEKPHFQTVTYDNSFFIDEIIDRKTPFLPESELNSSSKRHIRHCREYFDSVFQKESKDTLLKWMELVEKASVTEFHVSKKSDAAQIFAFQNDRGKPLSNLEVLKSYFMLQIYLRGSNRQDELVNQLNESFRSIYEAVVKTRLNEDDVLRYFWMAYGSYGYNTEDTLTEIKKHINDNGIDETVHFTKQLARSFSLIINIEQDTDFNVQNLRRLDRMALSLPVLIKSKVVANVSDDTYYRIVRFLENITFRDSVRGGRAEIESRLNGLLINSKDDVSFNDQINNFLDQLRVVSWNYYTYWNDNELRNALNSGGIYYKRKVCSYLLWRYEQSLCPKDYPAPRVNWEDVIKKESLEHIAPQSLKDEPIARGYGKYVDLEHPEEGIASGEWLNSIGNMLLLSQSQNSAAGNKSIETKLNIYKEENSLLRQQQKVVSYILDPEHPLWDKSCIERRGIDIIDAAMKIWDLKQI